jgi:hypothetical protein
MNRGTLPQRKGTPQAKVDVPGVVGQFLNDLAPTDLVVELIQNDLDAGASRTWIDFGTDAITSEGNGRAVDDKGWTRLEYVLGAGGEIEPKLDGIGSKNHGLRSVFLLADEIGVQSGGLRVDLTMRGLIDEPDKFYPAAWDREEDPTGPAQGTRVTAPYRTARILKPDGDGNFLQPPLPDELDELWSNAVDEAPERFICASAPARPWKYELTLSRAGRPSVVFAFESRALTGHMRGLYVRTCKVRREGRPARLLLQRHCARFRIDPDDLGQGKIPRLFRSGREIYGELSWIVDRRARPKASIGLLRYPISFPPESALTGAGFDISAPFTAGRARHALSDDRRNELMISAGHWAFAHLAAARLVRAYGPQLGLLVCSSDRPNDLRANRLVEMLLDAGGLSVMGTSAPAVRKETRSIPMDVNERLTLAVSLRTPGKLDRRLSSLVPTGAQVLHPDTPSDLVARLVHVAAGKVDLFNEENAARLAFIDLPAGESVSERHLHLCCETLSALEVLRRGGGIPHELVTTLKEKGKIPTTDGTAKTWAIVRRSEKPVPTIPGIAEPPIAHPSVMETTVLRDRPLRLPTFNLDEFVATRNFSRVIAGGRQRFFNWLKLNAGSLRTSTLKVIAGYPIWPGVDGLHRELDYYCRPKMRSLNDILGVVKIDPARDTIILATSKVARGVWKLRDQPRTGELAEWYKQSMAKVDELIGGDEPQAARAALRQVEDTLELLRKKIDAPIDEIASDHRTFPKEGPIAPVKHLHAPTAAVVACGLPATQVCSPRHVPLYEALHAHRRPTAGALVQALRNDPDQSRLFTRLEEFKRLGKDLAELAAERIIQVGTRLYAPEELAFRAEPDLWGQWKVRLDRTSDVAEHHGLLASLGVTQATLRGGLSRAFFEWLGQQQRDVQRNHLPQILRHWRDRTYGPLQWAPVAQHVPCLPVQGKGWNFELISLAEARNPRKYVFLDDFPEIREAALKDGKLRLTRHSAGQQSSVLTEFGHAGIISLRTAAGPARSISVEGAIEAPADLTRELEHLQSRPVRATLKSRLPGFGVPLSDIKADIQNLIRGLKGVRTGEKLLARYLVAGRPFEVPVAGGVDAASSLVCLAGDADRLTDFYGALADYLFKSGSSPLNAWGLLRAVRDRHGASQFEIEEIPEQPDVHPDTSASENPDGFQIHKGHGTKPENLTPVLPNPKPLPPIVNPTFLQKTRKRPQPPKHGSSTDELRRSIEEEEQIRALKEEHYAWHCQACLGEGEVLKVAPPGTYVFAPGYRRQMLHAHHTQHLQNKGALGGRNLLILCTYHHDILGDHLSRDKVRECLLKALPAVRAFPSDRYGKQLERRRGVLATVEIDIEPYVSRLYFTPQHADAWLV